MADKNLPLPINNNLPTLSSQAPVQSLEAYIRFAQSVPMLSETEENELAMRLKYQNDLEAAQRLIMAHLRFVIRVARDFSGYGLAQADLIQEGNIGLMKAVKRFDPNMGVRLVSFAVHWIKAEIHDYVIKNWRIVKVATTKAQRKLFFNLRSSKKRLGWMSQEEIKAIAKELNVKPSDVIEMEQRLNAHDASFDLPDDEESEQALSPIHFLPAPQDNPEVEFSKREIETRNTQALTEAMARLDARSQDILTQRWLNQDKATLHDLAAKYKVSAERIRQLEANALKVLKDTIAA